MNTVGIYTPYQRCETTAAALCLADLAISLSLSVRLLSSTPVTRGLHPFWDSQVRVARGEQIYRWAKGCQRLVWFELAEDRLDQARLVTDAPSCYVPSWHRLIRGDLERMLVFEGICCPSRAFYRFLVPQLEKEDRHRISWCHWFDGPVQPFREGACDPGCCRLFVPMDSHTIDTVGIYYLEIFADLLNLCQSAKIQLESAKSWSKRGGAMLKHLADCFPGRFAWQKAGPWPAQASLMAAHDWTLVPALRSDFGLTASRSLATGTPVIAHGVEPFSEIIDNEGCGLLIGGDATTNWAQGPVADLSWSATIDIVVDALKDDTLLRRCQRRSRASSLQAAREAFRGTWERQWNLPR